MSSDFTPEQRRELLDDFYAECDDLLIAMRESIAALERSAKLGQPAKEALHSLSRTVHTLKGICAIAGVRAAENLAHRLEDALRVCVKSGSATVPVDVLHATAGAIESIVRAQREQTATPDISTVEHELAGIAGNTANSAASDPIASPRNEAVSSEAGASARGGRRIFFAPSQELDARGVNVASVRSKLAQFGEIVSAVPDVRPDGSIQFCFTLRAEGEPPSEQELAAFGLWTEQTGATADPEFAPGSAVGLAPAHRLRVDLSRLDDLMRIAGDMVILRSRLEARLRGSGVDEQLRQISTALGRSLRELRFGLSRARMVPVGEIFTRMPHAVRDLARKSGKSARVELVGDATEIDKFVVERLKEPLLHLVRNAFTHGVESADERAKANKPAEAVITLRASAIGESVLIQVRDDGRGIDPSVVRARAISLGFNVGEKPTPDEILRILCMPGFSTQQEVSLAAGRGVGMDVVANTVRDLGGTVSLTSELGRGTEFTLMLPLTLAIIDAIIVSVGADVAAVPRSAVQELIQVPTDDVRTVQRTTVVPYHGGLLPIRPLRELFRLPPVPTPLLTILVIRGERGMAGLVVDRVHAEREVVVRRLADPLVRVEGLSGATELGDGRPILILNPVAITAGVVRPLETTEPRTSDSLLAS